MTATSLPISVLWAWLSGLTRIVLPTSVKSSLTSVAFRARLRTQPMTMTFAHTSIVRILVAVVGSLVILVTVLVVIVVAIQGVLTAALVVPVILIGAVTQPQENVTLALITIIASTIRICNAKRASGLVTPPPHAISLHRHYLSPNI